MRFRKQKENTMSKEATQKNNSTLNLPQDRILEKPGLGSTAKNYGSQSLCI